MIDKYDELVAASALANGVIRYEVQTITCMEIGISKKNSDRYRFLREMFESSFMNNALLRILEVPIEGVSPNEVPDGRVRVVTGKVVERKKRVLDVEYLTLLENSIPFNRGSSTCDSLRRNKGSLVMSRTKFEQIVRRKTKLDLDKKERMISEVCKVESEEDKEEQLLKKSAYWRTQ